MGSKKYTNISKRKLLKGLNNLQKDIPDLVIESATKHYKKLDHPFAQRSFPLAINHSSIHEQIVKSTKDWLVINQICTEKDFNNALGLKD